MEVIILLTLLMITILITAFPFLVSCKRYGMNFAIRRFIMIWILSYLILVLAASGFLLTEIVMSQRRMASQMEVCNEMISYSQRR